MGRPFMSTTRPMTVPVSAGLASSPAKPALAKASTVANANIPSMNRRIARSGRQRSRGAGMIGQTSRDCKTNSLGLENRSEFAPRGVEKPLEHEFRGALPRHRAFCVPAERGAAVVGPVRDDGPHGVHERSGVSATENRWE